MNDRYSQHAATAPPAAGSADAWLSALELEAPPLPLTVLKDMERLDAQDFATAQGQALADLEPLAALEAWRQAGSPAGATVLGLSGTGLRARLRCYRTDGELALFIQRSWSPLDDDTHQGSAKAAINGAFVLAKALQQQAAAVRAAGRWPAGRVLALVDDVFSNELRWGWLDAGATAGDAARGLVPDGAAYLSALFALREL